MKGLTFHKFLFSVMVSVTALIMAEYIKRKYFSDYFPVKK